MVVAAVALLVILLLIVELTAAIAPILIIIALVPREDRPALAHLLAQVDSSRRLRLWPAARAAAAARRRQLAIDRSSRSAAATTARHIEPHLSGTAVRSTEPTTAQWVQPRTVSRPPG